MVEAVVGEVGGRVHLRWRIRCTNPEFGAGTLLVEQQVYADAAPDGRLCDLALLCTGYRSEAIVTAVAWGAWDGTIRDDPVPSFAAARFQCPEQQVRLPDGHDAWVVLGDDAARQALGDERLSKNMIAALDEDREVVAEGLPGPDFAHHMLAMDAPDHRRLCGCVAAAFRASQSRPCDRRSSTSPRNSSIGSRPRGPGP